MGGKIKVLIADDNAATRESVFKLMEFHPEMIAIGQAENAEEAILKAKELRPDIILMDINMPGMDGIMATEQLTLEIPESQVIIMSVQMEQEYFRRAMMAGAKDYLTKPFGSDELLQAVKQVYLKEHRRRQVAVGEKNMTSKGKIIVVFSTKGGIGKTTIATNLAIAIANEYGGKVGLVDGDLQFGDVSLFMNILPKVTIADLVKDIDHLDENLLTQFLTSYKDSVQVLPAPFRPEQADAVSSSDVTAILQTMQNMFPYIIVDTGAVLNDVMLSVLDLADQILIVAAADVPTIKNIKLGLEIMGSLNYLENKVQLILNRENSEGGMATREIEESLRSKFTAVLPSDGKTVVNAVNRGIPFVVSSPKTPISIGIQAIAQGIVHSSGEKKIDVKHAPGVVNRLKRLFG